jgi:hypothetical protein
MPPYVRQMYSYLKNLQCHVYLRKTNALYLHLLRRAFYLLFSSCVCAEYGHLASDMRTF